MSYYQQRRDRTLDEMRHDDEDRRRSERREDVDEVYAAHVGEPWALAGQPIRGCVATRFEPGHWDIPLFQRTAGCPECWGCKADTDWPAVDGCPWHGRDYRGAAWNTWKKGA